MAFWTPPAWTWTHGEQTSLFADGMMSIKLMLGGQGGTAEWLQGVRSCRPTVPFERKEPALPSCRPQDMTASARLNPLVDDPGDRLCPAQRQLRNGLRHASVRSLRATVVQTREGPAARCAGLPVKAAPPRSGTQGASAKDGGLFR